MHTIELSPQLKNIIRSMKSAKQQKSAEPFIYHPTLSDMESEVITKTFNSQQSTSKAPPTAWD
ncbi:hypothetical protein [Paenibacillus eucommiae]|uniref:Uncharacterized protein n=1 Tax=Paenibacillus eucommiae TaxID=1355755 RepID=A0ABS4IZ94_9BACL|nr:hypothetical protein [Paenibacillus eucommiae]MBP1992913.1 hypothetical protein [Paenibacillus eucommiae]